MTENDIAAGKAGDSKLSAEEELQAGADTGAEADELEALREQAEDNWGKYLRAVAELDNLRKRNARDVESARRFGVERLAAALLPVRDSLEAGLKAISDADSEAVEIETLLEGQQATLRLLDQALDGVGIAEIDAEGESFDPERHEAMSMLPSPDAEPNSVLAVVQKGYSLHERVVRPARVIVARAPAGPDEQAPGTDPAGSGGQ